MNVARIFDKKASEMDKHPVINEVARVFAEQIKQHVSLSHDTVALDFGCGTGLVGMQLHSLVHSIVMIDTSEGMLAILRDKVERSGISNMRVYNADIFDPVFETARFDLAYVLNVLHHVPDIPELLAGFHRVLKPGANICIGDLEPEDGSFHEDGIETHHGFNASELGRMLEQAGFAVSRTYRMHTIRKPDRNGLFREYPLFFMIAGRC